MIKYYVDPSLIVQTTYDEEVSAIFNRLDIEVISKYQHEKDNVLYSSFHIHCSREVMTILEKELEEKPYLVILED